MQLLKDGVQTVVVKPKALITELCCDKVSSLLCMYVEQI